MPEIIAFPIDKTRRHDTAEERREKMKGQHFLQALNAAMAETEIPVGLIRHKKRTPAPGDKRGEIYNKVAEAIAL